MSQRPPNPSDESSKGRTAGWNEPKRDGQPAGLGVIAQDSHDTMLGRVLRDTYRIMSSLDEGGMGKLYRAEHMRLRRPVAVKFMARNLVANAEALARFRREAEIISQLDHPHIVHVLDFDTTPDGEPYIVMELLMGIPLSQRLAEQPLLPIREVVEIVFQISSGLLLAHRSNIVHRDLKPDNVFLLSMSDQRIFLKLLDFGISSGSSTGTRLTGKYDVLGTPDYMAPEQAKDTSKVDHRADQWSLACIAYEMLTGALPFPGESVVQILSRVVTGKPMALVEHVPSIPQAVQEVVLRGLSKDPELRFATIAEFADHLAKAAKVQLTSYGPNSAEPSDVSCTSVTLPAPPDNNPRRAKTKPEGAPRGSDRRKSAQDRFVENRIATPKVAVQPFEGTPLDSPNATISSNEQTKLAPVIARPRKQEQLSTVRSAHSRLRAAAMLNGQPPLAQKVESDRIRRYSKQRITSERPVQTDPHSQVQVNVSKGSPEIIAFKRVLDSIKKNLAQAEHQRAIDSARSALRMVQTDAKAELNAELEQATEVLSPILLGALGGPTQVLTVSRQIPSAQDASLNPQHMFLLSRIGGGTTVEELLDITPMSALDTMALLLDFLDQGYLMAK